MLLLKLITLNLLILTRMKILHINQTNLRTFFVSLLLVVFLFAATDLSAKTKEEPQKEDGPIKSEILSGLKFRSIGPAYASGRIADFAVNPDNPAEFYVGVASGNIWKTVNNKPDHNRLLVFSNWTKKMNRPTMF